ISSESKSSPSKYSPSHSQQPSQQSEAYFARSLPAATKQNALATPPAADTAANAFARDFFLPQKISANTRNATDCTMSEIPTKSFVFFILKSSQITRFISFWISFLSIR